MPPLAVSELGLHYLHNTSIRVSGLKEVNILGCHGQGKNVWKRKFFPDQGKVRECCEWPGKFRKDLKSQGKVREFENKWLWQAVF